VSDEIKAIKDRPMIDVSRAAGNGTIEMFAVVPKDKADGGQYVIAYFSDAIDAVRPDSAGLKQLREAITALIDWVET